ncbi:DUF459 domain-containing protein [Psychromarinibacter sp. C21-152]|uniref:DUF459 domain-containing protein n=1 Tax=Psychromarinibacter sediminicola TaxID=3033385 RepID=A0AAE3NW78_9RHOB|nr:DUF459 domain-containing protein [Psychromarinibacter sediminicola]MDF0603267.1 DUF459 domain-containing protein [Psychromarinibacter sediminicola]
MRKHLFGAVLGLLALVMASGQVQAAAGCPKSPMRVMVVGDSLADGLWASLTRTFAQCDTMRVVRLTAVSDGLAKTSGKDWIQRYFAKAGQVRDKSADIVVVQLGANDITAIRNGRTRESFNTETWNSLYQKRVMEMARTFEANAAEVFWFGLPIVGNTSWEPSYQIISQLQAAAVRKAGGRFIDIHELTKFGTGTFSMSGTIGGRVMQMRASDKVHFTKPGYDYVASIVLPEIEKVIANHNRRIALQDVEIQ